MITEILNKLHNWTVKYNISTLYIVGETPLCLFLNRIKDIQNIRLISLHENQSVILFKLLALECFNKKYEIVNNTLKVDYNGINIEIEQSKNCNYLKNQEIKDYIVRNKLNNHLDKCLLMQYITCHNLLYLPNTEEIKDICNSEKDINNKVIKTCLPEDLIFTYSNKIYFNVLYYAIKYNFSLSNDIVKHFSIDQVKNRISKETLNHYINKLMNIDKEKTVSILKELQFLE